MTRKVTFSIALPLGGVVFWPVFALSMILSIGGAARADQGSASLRGITRDLRGLPLQAVRVTLHCVEDSIDRTVLSGGDGEYVVDKLRPGRYQLTAQKDGAATRSAIDVELASQQNVNVDIDLTAEVASPTPPQGGFLKRFVKAYVDDWRGAPAAENAPTAPYRGYPPPVTNPPFPFAVWPIGGTPWIGYPGATSYPLTTALQTGPHGDWWKKANVQIYGWIDVGANVSTSHHGPYANAPAAYPQVANRTTLDQITLYIERVPDTVQKEHFDWGSGSRTYTALTIVSPRRRDTSASNC
jgi:Carboxypeptidase regulatory-like domain